MTEQDFMALAPYLTITVGILITLLLVSFQRRPALIFTATIVTLVATLIATVISFNELPHAIMQFVVVDKIGAFMNILFIIAALVTAVLSRSYLMSKSREPEEFFILLATATLGAMTLVVAHHFAALLLGLEILSISLYTLIGYPEEGQPPLEATLKYLILSGVASTIMLFGIALIYVTTRSLTFEFAVPAGGPRMEVISVIGQVMFIGGIAFKLSLVPFHMWTPDVYEGAPAPVAGYLATVSKGAVFIAVLRYVLNADATANEAIFTVIAFFGVASMIVGNLLALLQDNIKRLLAYSSIAHFGYLTITLLALTRLADQSTAVETSLFYLAGYFAMTLAAFAVITLLSSSGITGEEDRLDAIDLKSYEGLFWRHPVAATVLTLSMLSLAGIPLTVGFIAKFYLILTGIGGALWVLVWALIIGSAIAIYYYLRVVITMTRQPEYSLKPARSLAADSLTATVILGATIVALGVYPQPIIDFVRSLLATAGG